MPSALTLALTDAERRTLCDARKRHDKPYVRERAAALLKIDDGWSGRKVAREGLLQSRTPDTVYTSYHDWQDHGIAALHIEEGRGLWARFSPLAQLGGGGSRGRATPGAPHPAQHGSRSDALDPGSPGPEDGGGRRHS